MSPESLLRKAQALGDDIKEMESIDVLGAYYQAQTKIGSTLRYPTTFKKDNRLVELKGEAYFEVQADKDRPFYVNTPNGLSVYVYGTKFNVAAYEDDNYIETVLEKGKVNVITPDQETIVLAPGEQLLYDKQSQKSKKNKVDVYGKIAWKDGKLIFRNASLEEILKRLERHSM